MSKRILLLSAACSCAALIANVASANDDHAAVCQKHAQSVLSALDTGEFEQARSDFDQRMLDSLRAEQLKSIWESLPQQVGARISVADARVSMSEHGVTVALPLQYDKAWLDLQINCDDKGKVGGLWVRPGKAPASEAATDKLSANWVERDLLVASPHIKLPATLTLPRSGKPMAGVVLVHGSGAHDRDESIGPNKPFRDLAHGLAERNIAVLRYDKRSMVDPASFSGKAFTVREEVVDDAAAALKLLAQQSELSERPVFVAGHSLGALLAPRIAATQAVAGMILLAAPARSLTDIIPQQMDYIAHLDGKVSAEEQKAQTQMLTLVQAINALTVADQNDLTPLLGAPAAYWLDLRQYQPIDLAVASKIPTLLLQGESDYQVTMQDDYHRWTDGMKGIANFTSQSFPGLNHLFMTAGQPSGPTDYDHAGHVDPAVIAAIADWIKQQSLQ